MKRLTILVLALLGASLTTAGPARAGHVACGDTLVATTTLDADLECPGTALYIGVDGITLNLNGHLIRSLDEAGTGVDNSLGFDGITIKHGRIEGFREAVYAEDASGLTLKGLDVVGTSFSNLYGAIHVVDSSDVVIKDSSVTVPTTFLGTQGILLQSVEGADVKNVLVDGGFLGLSFGSLTPFDPPTNGSIRDSAFMNCFIDVSLQNTTDATVSGNVMSSADQGIRVGLNTVSPTGVKILENEVFGTGFGIAVLSIGPAGPLPIVGLEVRENNVHDNFAQGLTLVNVDDSVVADNHFSNNGDFGIRVWFGTGNSFTENVSTGQTFDMWAEPSSTPNLWRDNTCESSFGPDIDCP